MMQIPVQARSSYKAVRGLIRVLVLRPDGEATLPSEPSRVPCLPGGVLGVSSATVHARRIPHATTPCELILGSLAGVSGLSSRLRVGP